MSNATQSVAAARINSLLDANSFVEIGQLSQPELQIST